MCGCTGGAGILYGKSSSHCGSKVNSLSEARNKMAILFNMTTDIVKKEEYDELKNTIDNILKQSAITGTCPDSATVSAIVDEVNYEYSQYSNV